MIQPYLLKSVQATFKNHYKWFSINLNRFVTQQHVLLSGNLQTEARGRPSVSPWDAWIDEHLLPSSAMTYTKLLEQCYVHELQRLRGSDLAKSNLSDKEEERVNDRLRKRIQQREMHHKRKSENKIL